MEQNLIASLKETRDNLRDALSQAAQLEMKFLGPRPKDGQTGNPPNAESVGQLFSDLKCLSGTLVKMLATHHEMVGDFASNAAAIGGSPSIPRFA
jgi:hypothetical protein